MSNDRAAARHPIDAAAGAASFALMDFEVLDAGDYSVKLVISNVTETGNYRSCWAEKYGFRADIPDGQVLTF